MCLVDDILNMLSVKIIDNGRGMPLSKDLHASKIVLDKILAGSPITNMFLLSNRHQKKAVSLSI